MVDGVEQHSDIKPKHLIGDTAYDIASMLGWMVEEKPIEPHVPMWDKSERKDGTLVLWRPRAVVPPPRLRAFPLVFDAPDADRQRPSCGA